MALYNSMISPLDRAMNSSGAANTGPAPGVNQTTTIKQPDQSAMESVQNGTAPLNAFGQGNTVAGAIGSAFGPTFATPASLGYESGKSADNPWEAFIAGGVDANKKSLFSPVSGQGLNASHFIPQDPVNNMIAGGISGVAGFLF